jgi:hypothetical protein
VTASVASRHRSRSHNATKSCLLTVAREELRIAMHRPNGLSWRLIGSDDSTSGHQAVVALTAGTQLVTELVSASRAWTAQVLQGSVVYQVGRRISFGWPGDLLIGTARPWELHAEQATVLLLTCLSSEQNGRPRTPLMANRAST